jgi:hypothetical protein
MSWPLSHEFNEAIQNPQTAFSDPDLKGGETVVGATGLPLPRSGNFADVYQVRGPDGREWAVKCFTRPVAGLAERYARVSEALARANLPFTVGFTYLAEGMLVGGAWRPIVKMEWVEGLLLNQVARENAAKPSVLSALCQMWVKLCKRLREAGVAHADIQHGNVMLVPGSRPGAYGLKLIDYDGMWVQSLANTPSGESGHPAYQHPARAATSAYSPDLDRFPHLAVATALRALAIGGSALWERHDNGDNLLFTEGDYKKPAESALMKELWRTENPAVQALVGRLAIACSKPLPQTPWLDQLAPEGEPAPLDDATRREATAALGIAAPVAVVAGGSGRTASPSARGEAVPEAVAIPAELSDPKPARKESLRAKKASEEEPEHEEDRPSTRPRKHRSKYRGPQSKKQIPIWGWAAAVAVFVCIGVVSAVLVFRPKPPEVAQTPREETPVKPKDPPPPKKPHVDPPQSSNKEKDPPPVAPLPRVKEKEKEKEKEPDPPPKPKDPPKREPVALKSSWIVPANSDEAPVTLQIRDQTILWGGPRTSLAAFDLRTGEKRPAFNLIDLTGGDNFWPLDGGHVAKYAPDDLDIRTWGVKDGAREKKIPLPAFPPVTGVAKHKLAWPSPNRQSVAVTRGALATAPHPAVAFRVFPTNDTAKAVVDVTWEGGSVHFTADSSRLLVAEYSGRFRWFAYANEPETEWTYPPPPAGRAHKVTDISSKGQVIGYNGPARSAGDAEPYLLDGKGEILHRFGEGYAANSPVVVSGDGRFAAVLKKPVEGKVTIEVVSVPKGEVIAWATTMTDTTPTFTLSDDGHVLLVHNAKSGKLERFDLP